jgi:hypothetical protein
MHRNKTALFALVGTLAFATTSPAEAANMDTVNNWIIQAKGWSHCEKPNLLLPQIPFFAFNDPLARAPIGSCSETGPIVVRTYVDGFPVTLHWWVQLISNLDISTISKVQCDPTVGATSCYRDVIRVCATEYARKPPPPTPPNPLIYGPCQRGIGQKGCEICETTDHTNVVTN